jgi:predicted nucleic acid-binding protein
MFLIDTSVWIDVFRDCTGVVRQSLEALINDERIFISRFTQMELLQGCRDDREWTLLETYLQDRDYIEPTADTWVAAARIYYDLQAPWVNG